MSCASMQIEINKLNDTEATRYNLLMSDVALASYDCWRCGGIEYWVTDILLILRKLIK